MKFGKSIKKIMLNMMMVILFFAKCIENCHFGQIWSKIEKCLVLNEIWHKYQTNHAECDADIIFYKIY